MGSALSNPPWDYQVGMARGREGLHICATMGGILVTTPPFICVCLNVTLCTCTCIQVCVCD